MKLKLKEYYFRKFMESSKHEFQFYFTVSKTKGLICLVFKNQILIAFYSFMKEYIRVRKNFEKLLGGVLNEKTKY